LRSRFVELACQAEQPGVPRGFDPTLASPRLPAVGFPPRSAARCQARLMAIARERPGRYRAIDPFPRRASPAAAIGRQRADATESYKFLACRGMGTLAGRLHPRRVSGPGKMKKLEEYLVEAAENHGHMCPGQVLGVRMAMLGLRELGIEDPAKHQKHLVTFVE